MLRIYWRSPLTKYYWWISKFTKSDFKFMEILTMSNESCQCDQISIHDNRRTYEGFFKRDFNFFYMLFHENVIEPPFGFNIFLQYAFNLYTRLSINVISRPYVSVLIIGWGQILFLHSVDYCGWARYRAAHAYHVALLQNICFTCEWRVFNYLISSLTRLTYYIMYFKQINNTQ